MSAYVLLDEARQVVVGGQAASPPAVEVLAAESIDVRHARSWGALARGSARALQGWRRGGGGEKSVAPVNSIFFLGTGSVM